MAGLDLLAQQVTGQWILWALVARVVLVDAFDLVRSRDPLMMRFVEVQAATSGLHGRVGFGDFFLAADHLGRRR